MNIPILQMSQDQQRSLRCNYTFNRQAAELTLTRGFPRDMPHTADQAQRRQQTGESRKSPAGADTQVQRWLQARQLGGDSFGRHQSSSTHRAGQM